ncbi:hypothetical protein J7L48_09680 [bacterium]|nr:hypothetical protein [bacterium]
MKKILFISFALFLTIFMVSCGSKTQEENNVAKPVAQKATQVEKKNVPNTPTVTLIIADSEEKFQDVTIRNDAPNPGVVSYAYSVNANIAKDGLVGFYIGFTYKNGVLSEPDLDLKNYNVTDITITVSNLKTKKSKFGGIRIDKLNLSFKGTAKKLGNNGFPTKEVVKFEGTVIK